MADAAAPTANSDTFEEMPDFEELTPELMEDECLRGDIVLRWALCLLAVLLSWTTITESPLLVQIRSGEYMLSHGILPPRVDLFSASAEGRAWVNSSWLSDLLLGGLHSLLGMSALTLLCSATVAVSFFLLSAVRIPQVSTWWGTCCGLLALVALFPTFQPGSSTFMILGLSILMFLLVRESLLPANAECFGPLNRFGWYLPYVPVLFLIWMNCDPRAWVGLVLLGLFLAGDSISRKFRGQPQSRRDWGVFLVSCLVAAVLTPWPFQPFLNMIHLWDDQQTLQDFNIISEFFPRLIYGWKDPLFWKLFDIYALSSLVLAGLSCLTLLFNFKRLNLGWLGMWLGANLLSLIDGEFVCDSAVVNAVIATINGQDWYRAHFSMDYAVDRFSVLWGRGGRAAMVLSFFLIAYLSINGAFMGPQSRRLGLGLDPRWTARIESLQDEVVAHSYTDRIFPTLPSQGDLLIWIGKQPFIDSRATLYASGPENLLKTHQDVRSSLFTVSTPEKPIDPEAWRKTLASSQTFDVLVRLWGPLPPYEPMIRMLESPKWVMTGLGSAGANFTRIDLQDEPLLQHAGKFAVSHYAERAFRPAKSPQIVSLQAVWPLPVSRYDRWLIQRREMAPSSAELAAHYDNLLMALRGRLPVEQATGLAMLAVRKCRQALAENPNHPLAYRVLARAYRALGQIQQQVSQAAGVAAGPSGYHSQILAATYAAVIAGGGAVPDLQLLLEANLSQQQRDVSLKTLERLQAKLKEFPAGMVSPERIEEFSKLHEELKQGVEQARTEVEHARAGGAQRPQLISIALQRGCPALAVTLLEEDRTEMERTPELKLLYASLLIQTGEFEEALGTLEGMEPYFVSSLTPQMQPLVTQWRHQTASVNLAMGNAERALTLWASEDQSYIRLALQSLLQMPFAAFSLPIQYELWPAFSARMAANAAIEIPERVGHLQMQSALAELELGQLDQARERLRKLIRDYPLCSQRFLAAYYLRLLTGKPIQVEPVPSAGKAANPQETPPAEKTPENSVSQ